METGLVGTSLEFVRISDKYKLRFVSNSSSQTGGFYLANKLLGTNDIPDDHNKDIPYTDAQSALANVFAQHIFKNGTGPFDVTINGFELTELGTTGIYLRSDPDTVPTFFDPLDLSMTRNGRRIEFHPSNSLNSYTSNKETVEGRFKRLNRTGNPAAVSKYLAFPDSQTGAPTAGEYIHCKPDPGLCRQCAYRPMVFDCQTQGYFSIKDAEESASITL